MEWEQLHLSSNLRLNNNTAIATAIVWKSRYQFWAEPRPCHLLVCLFVCLFREQPLPKGTFKQTEKGMPLSEKKSPHATSTQSAKEPFEVTEKGIKRQSLQHPSLLFPVGAHVTVMIQLAHTKRGKPTLAEPKMPPHSRRWRRICSRSRHSRPGET